MGRFEKVNHKSEALTLVLTPNFFFLAPPPDLYFLSLYVSPSDLTVC